MDNYKLKQRMERLEKVNELIKLIGDLGRRFFWSERTKCYAQMTMNGRGRLYWQDQCTLKSIYLHYRYWGKGFTNGGTMRHLVNMLKRYVMTGQKLPHLFGPWPKHVCNGDLWGYGLDNMATIRAFAINLEMLEAVKEKSNE